MVKLHFENSSINEKIVYEYDEMVSEIHKKLHIKANDENEFLGWMELPTNYNKEEFGRIKKASEKIKKDSDVLVVIGIGGSYLGAKAVIDALTHTFHNSMPDEKRYVKHNSSVRIKDATAEKKTPQIVYAGQNLSPVYMNELLEFVADKDISINVISKSGTTTEPAIAFRIFREVLETKYGVEEARKRIYVTTDSQKGALKTLSDEENYETFVVPDNIGGRFSVLTAVGLLPIATAGIDIDKLMKGAKEAQDKYVEEEIKYNDCYKYAVVRNLLYKSDKTIEILANYEPKLHFFTEWWKQLYGESEGKNSKGIFPAGVDLTTDLHSMGQYIQDGRRDLFETVIKIKENASEVTIQEDDSDLDGLNFLAGKELGFVNEKAMEGTILAHVNGNVPNIMIEIDKLNEENIGHLIYFFEKACAVSGTMLGVNPFDQPGVEEYKKNMFRLLGKPGY